MQQSIETSLNTDFNESDMLKAELLEGLKSKSKYINPKFFYDEKGSQLFEEIMQLPEYYPTRTEISLLKKHHKEIAAVVGEDTVLIEPGAGNCEKIQYLLATIDPSCYIPVDISADFLFECAAMLQKKFPDIDIHAIADDMQARINIPETYNDNKKVIFYPGSTIGNYTPDDALEFLKHARQTAGENGGLLIGVDLQKDKEILDAAYNDEQGVTAEFNLNVINHVNNLLDCDINPEYFEHVAFYNEKQSRIEMHLESKISHTCRVPEHGEVEFDQDERIHTEYSYKYTLDSFSELAARADLNLEKFWVDDQQLFSIQYYAT